METIGGFRLVRLLGSGSRAEVHLGQSTIDVSSRRVDASSPVHSDPVARSVAIKVFRAATPIASIDREIESLARASSRHLLELDDLTTDRSGHPALVLRRVGPRSLSSLLTGRRTIGPGEAVTILAPIVEAVAELHRVGVAHQRIRTGNILFDSSGAPVLVGFGHTALIGPMPVDDDDRSLTPAAAAVSPELRADLDQVIAVIRTVLECTPATAARDALMVEMVDGIAEAPTRGAALGSDRLTDLLFAHALPEAVAMADETPAARKSAVGPGRSAARRSDALRSNARGSDARLPATPTVGSTPSAQEETNGWTRLLDAVPVPLPDWLWGLAAPDPAHADRSTAPPTERGAVRALRAFLAPVRRSVWIAAGVVTALLVTGGIAVAALESGSDTATSDGAVTSGAQGGAGAPGDLETPQEQKANGDPGGVQAPDPASSEATSAKASATADAAAAEQAIVGDEPVAAARALIDRRSACFSDASVLCLDRVAQVGSAALDADTVAMRALQESGDPDPVPRVDPMSAVLVGRWGGSAMVSFAAVPDSADDTGGSAAATPDATASDPATVSILIIDGEDGWRIRDITVG